MRRRWIQAIQVVCPSAFRALGGEFIFIYDSSGEKVNSLQNILQETDLAHTKHFAECEGAALSVAAASARRFGRREEVADQKCIKKIDAAYSGTHT